MNFDFLKPIAHFWNLRTHNASLSRKHDTVNCDSIWSRSRSMTKSLIYFRFGVACASQHAHIVQVQRDLMSQKLSSWGGPFDRQACLPHLVSELFFVSSLATSTSSFHFLTPSLCFRMLPIFPSSLATVASTEPFLPFATFVADTSVAGRHFSSPSVAWRQSFSQRDETFQAYVCIPACTLIGYATCSDSVRVPLVCTVGSWSA